METMILQRADIDPDNSPWDYENMIVLVNSPQVRNMNVIIAEPYDPEEEDDEDVEYGEVFWCKRLDGKPWPDMFKHGVKWGKMWLAIHYQYMFKPYKGDWDVEENGHE